MILKSIEMQGFKSFADKIYLDFNSGITAIVGPNGSGKSNISDAIRWVMGEQSIKSLRGSKMEDVIFAGTANRKALGFAEVTLCLDNGTHFFDIDFPEVHVTRRLYRSGESEYYINKTLCRLKDVHELFMDTGLGRDGYSIIGQGQIDSVLSTKSEDRRQIFEEASGISKYKYRKNEAEKKLAQTTDNLTRVENILGELETQVEPLRRQSEKAKKYLIFQSEMKDLEIGVSIININRKRENLEKLKNDIDIYSNQISDIQNEIDKNDSKVAAMYSESEKTGDKIEKLRNDDKELTESIHELTNNINLIGSNIEHASSTISRLESEVSVNDSRAKDLDAELKEQSQRIASLNTQSGALEMSSKDLGDSAKKIGLDVSEKSKKIENLRSEIISKTTAAENARNAVENFNILKENFLSRQNVIDTDLNTKDSDINLLKEKLSKLDNDIKKKDNDIESLKNEINRLEEEYGKRTGEIQKIITEKNKSNVTLGQITSRRKTLSDMERDLEGYSHGVKSVMRAKKQNALNEVGIHAPLSQLIKVDSKYVTAIETALGNMAQNIVTDTPEEAKIAINYLKKNNLGRATFLPISSIKPRDIKNSDAESCSGYIDTADSLVNCDDKYRDIIKNLLSSTVIADNIDNAIKMGKKCSHKFRIVTLGGDVIQAGGAMTGGSVAKSLGSLSRANEIEKLGNQISKIECDLDDYNKKLETLSVENTELMDNIKSNNELLSNHNDEYIRMCSEKSHTSEIIQTADSDREQLLVELNELKQKLSEIDKDISEKTSNAAALEAEARGLEKKETEEQRLFAELSGKNEELTSTLLDLSLRKNSILKDIEQTNENIRRINEEKSQLMSSIQSKLSEIEELRKSIAKYETEREQNQKDVEVKREKTDLSKKELDELISQRQEIENKIKEQQKSVKGIQESMFKLSGLHAKAQSRYENVEAELESIINHLWEEYELTYSDAAASRDLSDFDYTNSSKRISELKKEIKALGNINIDSIEEYKNVKERADFLREQTNDLEKSKKELIKIIDEMLEIMKTRFSEQFKIINENFSQVFSELFGGGNAKLSLIDPDNVLESGIEIEAQPPGKKLQSLTLLSGGERAFTAIALLFAILKVRPTPFCILDEIEAALDDVNVYRYAEYLKQFSEKTQFIVVTHRRGTMEAANILYGVTMQEKGVSKLLTLNIDEVQE